MVNDLVEQRIVSAVNEALGERAVKVLKGVYSLASKQGGGNAVENYQILGKKALVVAGVVVVVIQVATWVGGTVISRRLERRRIEQTVRRVLEEERQRELAEAESA